MRKGELPPWIVSDGLWERIEPLLPQVERNFRYPGRKRLDDRLAGAAGAAGAMISTTDDLTRFYRELVTGKQRCGWRGRRVSPSTP